MNINVKEIAGTSSSDSIEVESGHTLLDYLLDLLAPIFDSSTLPYESDPIQEILGTLNDTRSETKLNHLAYQIAENYVQANLNIGAFVIKTTADRKVILTALKNALTSNEEVHTIIDEIQDYYDRFIYHTVSLYTDMKEKNNQLRNHFIEETHIERLTLLGQMSSSFVHEFRNPLTTIIGFMKLLKNNQSKHEYIDIIQRELQQLSDRISQFLQLSKKGTMHLKKEAFPLANVIIDLKELFFAKFLEEYVSIELDVDPTITLWASVEEIKQIILNILMNSVEALQQKPDNRKICVQTYTTADEFVISICNNGPTIPPETLKSIFEPFYTKKEKGTGLGLFVCKQLIEASHGRIYCQSTEECTTFFICFQKDKHKPIGENTNNF